MMSLDSIVWPDDLSEARRIYISYLVEVVGSFQLDFPLEENPVEIAKNFLKGEVSQGDFDEAVTVWWEYLERESQFRDLTDRKAILARLAICFFSSASNGNFNDHLSWFLEVLHALDPKLQYNALQELRKTFTIQNMDQE